MNESKKSKETLQKEIVELKKENKKRKKLIETQQRLIDVNANNHQIVKKLI